MLSRKGQVRAVVTFWSIVGIAAALIMTYIILEIESSDKDEVSFGSAAVSSDLDYWFCNMIDAEYDFFLRLLNPRYAENFKMDLSSAQNFLTHYASGGYDGEGRRSNYWRAPSGPACPNFYSKKGNVMSLSCDENVLYHLDIPYDYWLELGNMPLSLSTMGSRRVGWYQRAAFLQGADNSLIKLSSEVMVTK